jgi:catechol 2,3-dioxygenase-like lactoylglutathione lyase family enzyme
MIEGAHSIIYSTDPDADRAFFRDVLGLPNVDVGGGWLIFGLPPAEIAFHPAQASGKHEFYFMVRNIEKFASWMGELSVPCTAIHDERWGRLVDITLPGGGALGVYQPRHARPPSASAG